MNLTEKFKQQHQTAQTPAKAPEVAQTTEPKTEAAQAKESMVENPLKPSIPPVEHGLMAGTEATPQADPTVHSGAAQAQPSVPVNQTATSDNGGKMTATQAKAVEEQQKKAKEAPGEYPVGGRG